MDGAILNFVYGVPFVFHGSDLVYVPFGILVFWILVLEAFGVLDISIGILLHFVGCYCVDFAIGLPLVWIIKRRCIHRHSQAGTGCATQHRARHLLVELLNKQFQDVIFITIFMDVMADVVGIRATTVARGTVDVHRGSRLSLGNQQQTTFSGRSMAKRMVDSYSASN